MQKESGRSITEDSSHDHENYIKNKLNSNGRYLIQDGSGHIYIWSEALAKRKDMRPYDPITGHADPVVEQSERKKEAKSQMPAASAHGKMMALTDLKIKTAKIKGKPYKLFDSDGFYLLVTPEGKTWRFIYPLLDKMSVHTYGVLAFGNYPEVTLSEARKKRKVAEALIKNEQDPAEVFPGAKFENFLRDINDALLPDVEKKLRHAERKLAEANAKEAARRVNYQQNQGRASADVGTGNIKRAQKVLEKCGGIDGYQKLSQGQKKPIRDEIEKICRYKDSRNVYNLIKKIKQLE
ncbi:MAG: Arm DNA-binding domain-containing protein [Deltaproteobacteria bacterium]|nr:Arm DNA-binding domain-containing protein [Deltaproteobacteria bacterium]